jgi:hypothetical protein
VKQNNTNAAHDIKVTIDNIRIHHTATLVFIGSLALGILTPLPNPYD